MFVGLKALAERTNMVSFLECGSRPYVGWLPLSRRCFPSRPNTHTFLAEVAPTARKSSSVLLKRRSRLAGGTTRCHDFPAQCSIIPPFSANGPSTWPTAQASLALTASTAVISMDEFALMEADTRQPVLAVADRTWAEMAYAGGAAAVAASAPAIVVASVVAMARAEAARELAMDEAVPRLKARHNHIMVPVRPRGWSGV